MLLVARDIDTMCYQHMYDIQIQLLLHCLQLLQQLVGQRASQSASIRLHVQVLHLLHDREHNTLAARLASLTPSSTIAEKRFIRLLPSMPSASSTTPMAAANSPRGSASILTLPSAAFAFPQASCTHSSPFGCRATGTLTITKASFTDTHTISSTPFALNFSKSAT